MADDRAGARSAAMRAAVLAVCVALLASLAGVAGAEPTTEQKLEAAEAEVERLLGEIREQRALLDRLSDEAGELAAQVTEAEVRWRRITEELRVTRAELQAARAQYARLREQLDQRAREAYMSGPGEQLEFILGSSSLADLSDRVAFVDALTQTDADLANQVANLRNELADQAAREQRLQEQAAEALREQQARYAALEAKLAEQRQVLDVIEERKARAEELVKDLRKEWQRELAAATGLRIDPNAILQVCPVDQPRAVYDGFGAPRDGGSRAHAGNDIIAPMGTPIRAPFPGTARSSWNPLGGNAVYVYGEHGYVYNAHLSAFSDKSNGPVQAGDIIGYVGSTGNSSTPHNHFEWHPNVIPSNWPASPYGYSVIGGAVNPWPLLQAVC